MEIAADNLSKKRQALSQQTLAKLVNTSDRFARQRQGLGCLIFRHTTDDLQQSRGSPSAEQLLSRKQPKEQTYRHTRRYILSGYDALASRRKRSAVFLLIFCNSLLETKNLTHDDKAHVLG